MRRLRLVSSDLGVTLPALVLAALLAALLAARGDERQGAVARGLAALLVINAARPFLVSWLPLYVAGFVAFYAVTTWAVEAALTPRGPRTGQTFAVLVCGAGTALRFDAAESLGRAAFALSLAAQLLAALRFAMHGRRPDAAQRVALILVASSFADAFGPWLIGRPDRDWPIGRAISLATWIAIAADQTRALVRGRLEDRGG